MGSFVDIVTIVLATLWSVCGQDESSRQVACYHHDDNLHSVYNFSMPDIHGEKTIDFSQYRGKQEPGANGTEILNMLKHVRPGSGFVPNFTLTQKTDVNGEKEHALFTYLKAYCPPVDDIFYTETSGIYYKPYHNSDVRWNFEKFLINKEGKAVMRYPTRLVPSALEKDIEDLLEEGSQTNSYGGGPGR